MAREEISPGLRVLFKGEISNEHIEETGQSRDGSSAPGGTNPATLDSALDSLRQGLNLEQYGFDTAQVQEELQGLIAKHGGDTEVRDFLSSGA